MYARGPQGKITNVMVEFANGKFSRQSEAPRIQESSRQNTTLLQNTADPDKERANKTSARVQKKQNMCSVQVGGSETWAAILRLSFPSCAFCVRGVTLPPPAPLGVTLHTVVRVV